MGYGPRYGHNNLWYTILSMSYHMAVGKKISFLFFFESQHENVYVWHILWVQVFTNGYGNG